MSVHVDALARRIDKAIAKIDTQAEQEIEPFMINRSLYFSAQELEQLEPLLAKLDYEHGQHKMFEQLSKDELNALYHWLKLYVALEAGDYARAEKLKRYALTPLEQLVALFLAIDIHAYSGGPVNSEPVGTVTDVDGVSRKLYKGDYNNIKVNGIENAVYGPERLKDSYFFNGMWQWVEWHEQEQGIAASAI